MKTINAKELQDRLITCDKFNVINCVGIRCINCIFHNSDKDCIYVINMYDVDAIKEHKFKQKSITIKSLNRFRKDVNKIATKELQDRITITRNGNFYCGSLLTTKNNKYNKIDCKNCIFNSKDSDYNCASHSNYDIKAIKKYKFKRDILTLNDLKRFKIKR